MEENPVQSDSLREVEIEPNVKLECMPKFFYLGDTLGARGSVGGGRKSQSVMCVKLKDRMRSVDFYSLLDIQSVAEVVNDHDLLSDN